MESAFWKDYSSLKEDPIRAERERLARERYIENLFRPFHDHDGMDDISWLVEGLLPMGYLALLAGNPKSGKTCFATALALAVAHGLPFAGRPTKQGSVLWLAAEESPIERRALLKDSPLYDTDAPFWTCYERLNIDDPEGLELLDEWLFRTHARLIVVDPLMGAMGGRSLQDSWNARKTLQPLKEFCMTRYVSAIVLHHQKRDYYRHRPSVADSSQLAAVSSMSIVLSSFQSTIPPLPACRERGPGGEGSESATKKKVRNKKDPEPRTPTPVPSAHRIVRLSCEGRGAWANRTQLFASAGPLDYLALDAEPTELMPEKPMTANEKSLFDQLTDPAGTTVEELAERTQNSEQNTRNYLANLRRKGHVVVAPGSNWPKKFIQRPQNPGVGAQLNKTTKLAS